MLDFISPQSQLPLHKNGNRLISNKGESFPIINDIPRFVDEKNYANAFGLQWKKFAKTQLDSYTGMDISKVRLERCLGFSLNGLQGKTVLEVGSGAGRFTELLVMAGAETHSVDLSAAVDVNKENVGVHENYKIAQASVYELPFPKASFDIVVCLGVIQHTPSTKKTIEALYEMVKPGGLLVIDHYIWRIGFYSTLTPLYRLIIKELNPKKSQKIVKSLVDFFFPLHWKYRNNKPINWLIHRVSPLIFAYKYFPEKDRSFHYEWSLMETNDQLTDYYKRLKTPNQIRKILTDLKAEKIWVEKGGNGIEARCTKPVSNGK